MVKRHTLDTLGKWRVAPPPWPNHKPNIALRQRNALAKMASALRPIRRRSIDNSGRRIYY
jgi:hypothetical protein